MTWLIAPVIGALFIKLTILLVARRAAIKTEYLFAFIATFAVHNVCEIFLFVDAADGAANMLLYRVYYATTFVLVAYACSMGIQIADVRKYPIFKLLERTIWVGSATGVALSLVGGQILAGLSPLSYAYTAVQGPFYWVFQGVSIAALLICILALTKGASSNSSGRTHDRSVMALIAFLPVVLGALTVLALMEAGYNVNGMVVLPFASAIFLCVLVYSEHKHRLTDLKRLVPGSHQNEVANRLQDLFSSYALGDVGYYPAIEEIESLLVSYVHDKNEGNIMRTADQMQISRSTLYKKMSKYSIGRKHNKDSASAEAEQPRAQFQPATMRISN